MQTDATKIGEATIGDLTIVLWQEDGNARLAAHRNGDFVVANWRIDDALLAAIASAIRRAAKADDAPAPGKVTLPRDDDLDAYLIQAADAIQNGDWRAAAGVMPAVAGHYTADSPIHQFMSSVLDHVEDQASPTWPPPATDDACKATSLRGLAVRVADDIRDLRWDRLPGDITNLLVHLPDDDPMRAVLVRLSEAATDISTTRRVMGSIAHRD